jgi:predicted transcriptional regulator
LKKAFSKYLQFNLVRKIPKDKINEIVKLRTSGVPVNDIAKRLGVSRATVYNYLSKVQAFADENFIKELEEQLKIMHAIYHSNSNLMPISDHARRMAVLIRKYIMLPDEAICQALLNANWRMIQKCRKHYT